MDEHPPFTEQARLLFHVDEGMSWENVRDLRNIEKGLVLIRNVVAQAEVSQELSDQINQVRGALDEVFEALAQGEIL